MSVLSFVLTLVVVGILLYLLNTYLAAIIDGKILKIINIVVVVIVILWVLTVFGLLPLGDVKVPRVQ